MDQKELIYILHNGWKKYQEEGYEIVFDMLITTENIMTHRIIEGDENRYLFSSIWKYIR